MSNSASSTTVSSTSADATVVETVVASMAPFKTPVVAAVPAYVVDVWKAPEALPPSSSESEGVTWIGPAEEIFCLFVR